MDANANDRMLELCYSSVEKMASAIDDHAEELNEHGVLQEPQKINKFFHTLGAAVGNFLLTFADISGHDEHTKHFRDGLKSFFEFCKEESKKEADAPPFKDRPGSLRVLGWFIDNQLHHN